VATNATAKVTASKVATARGMTTCKHRDKQTEQVKQMKRTTSEQRKGHVIVKEEKNTDKPKTTTKKAENTSGHAITQSPLEAAFLGGAGVQSRELLLAAAAPEVDAAGAAAGAVPAAALALALFAESALHTAATASDTARRMPSPLAADVSTYRPLQI
jgi:hypothetical protein